MFVRFGPESGRRCAFFMMRSTMASLSLRFGNIELLMVGLSTYETMEKYSLTGMMSSHGSFAVAR